MYNIRYGNLEGKYFTQWRIDFLQELLEIIVYCYAENPIVHIESINIWYDSVNDYHMLDFRSGDFIFEIRFYKCFSVKINGDDGWTGCPRHKINEFARYVRDKCKRI